jgi:hypothetical protein
VTYAKLRRMPLLPCLMRTLLLINKLGIIDLGARREINFLASDIPVVQVPDAHGEVGRESL